MLDTLKVLGNVGLGASVAAPLLSGPVSALNEHTWKPLVGRETQEDRQINRALMGPTPQQQMMRQRRLQEAVSFNQAVLAQQFPGLYAKLLAGRPLPRGAVVIGGRPQVENVESVALSMAMGQVAPPSQMSGIIGP